MRRLPTFRLFSKKAEAIKDFIPGQFNITKVDGIVSDFANFEAWIADGKEPAAVYEWGDIAYRYP